MRVQGARVHVPIGGECNNHCLFCMEADRVSRARAAKRMTAARVRELLAAQRGVEEVCFTSGEPTMRPELGLLVRWARESGCARVSLMTNGRRLAYAPYLASLVDAGLRRVYVSIHGNHRALHEGLTRAPGSFAQTIAGLRNVAKLVPGGMELHTTTVLTTRNLERLSELRELLEQVRVGQAVFTAMQLAPRPEGGVSRLMPRYREIREAFARMIAAMPGVRGSTFLVDVPLCMTEGLDDATRGFVERRVHYEADRSVQGADAIDSVSTGDLDRAFRVHGPRCERCRYVAQCPGVYRAYVDVWGWEEIEPVP